MEYKFDVAVVGGCTRDLTSYVSRLPKSGETVIGQKFIAAFGGKGANQCIAAAILGAKSAMIANVGNDSYGTEFVETFIAHNVNADLVTKSDKSHTGIGSLFVTDSGENCIVLVPGANNYLTPEHIHLAESAIKHSKVLVCQLEVNFEAIFLALKLAKSHGVKTVFNAAPMKTLPDELFPLCDIFCVNETEAECVSGQSVGDVDDAYAAGEIILSKGCHTVIVTLGEKGAVYLCQDQSKGHVLTKKVLAVDTTGAGDAFVGSLAFYMAKYSYISLPQMIKRSCEYASYSVQKPGAFVSFPWRKDLPQYLFD
ncbi:hypothetical protein CHUAL_010858 [Chamberlinius hualienensis]